MNRVAHRPLRQTVIAFMALLLVVILTGWAQRRTLAMFFGPDDYIHLEQASGVLPPPPTVWRILSQVWYFKSMLTVFGPYPPAFHLASLLLHFLNMGMLFVVLGALRASLASRLAIVGVFGLLPLQYTALLHAVNINDIGAAALTLAACLFLLRPGAFAVVASPTCYLAALFSKESVLMLAATFPALTLATHQKAGRAVPHLAIAAGFGALFIALRARGLAPGGEVYEARVGWHVFHNYMTYVAWGVDLRNPIPDLIGSYEVHAWRLALPIILGSIATAVRLPRARSIVLLGWGWFTLACAPVVLLTHHTYSHYMYVPSIGLAMALAGTVVAWIEAAMSRSDPKRSSVVATVSATLLICGYAATSDNLIARRIDARLSAIDWPSDPLTRKVVVGQRMLLSVAPTIGPQTRCIALLALPGDHRVFGARSGAEYAPARVGYDLVEEVLDHGRAFRLFWPQLDSVRFASTWSRSMSDCDAYVRGIEGDAVYCGRGPTALVKAGRIMSNTRDSTGLIAYARSVVDAFPQDTEAQGFLRDVSASGEPASPTEVRKR